MKKAVIDRDKCVGCGACIIKCPVHAIKMIAGWKSTVDITKCIGCGTCVLICHKNAPKLLKPT